MLNDLLLDSPLPFSRAPAKQLGVSRNTVIHSYQLLVDDGYLNSMQCSGHFVIKNIV